MSERKFLLDQTGPLLQEILNRDVIITEEEYEALKVSGEIDEKKFYFVLEE